MKFNLQDAFLFGGVLVLAGVFGFCAYREHNAPKPQPAPPITEHCLNGYSFAMSNTGYIVQIHNPNGAIKLCIPYTN